MVEDWKVISSIVEKDLFHETYRSTLVPWMEEVRTITKQEGLDTRNLPKWEQAQR